MARDPQKWSPFRELDRVRHDFEELLDRSLGSGASRAQHGPFTPAIESFIDSGKLIIRADLPGVDPKDVDVTVTGDQLTIRAARANSASMSKAAALSIANSPTAVSSAPSGCRAASRRKTSRLPTATACSN